MVEAALNCGLSGMAFTEHGEQVPREMLDLLEERWGVVIYSGVELRVNRRDVLVHGIADARFLFGVTDYASLVYGVHDHGGAVSIAHPFRKGLSLGLPCWDSPDLRPDGIEARSRNTPSDAESEIRSIARKYDLGVLVNSDAHKPRHVGGFYTETDRLPVDDAELVAFLRRRVSW
jgi:histidinol phosphatase-like PHP family hydrolase